MTKWKLVWYLMVAAIACFALWVLSQQEAREARQAIERNKPIVELVERVRPLVPRCEELGEPKNLAAPSKALVVDLRTGSRLQATDKLPPPQQGEPSDADLLVFAVVSVTEELVPKYYSNGEAGYRLNAKVAVLRWPEKEAVGLVTIRCDPPMFASVMKGEIPKGDLSFYIGLWIERLSNAPKRGAAE